MTQRYSRRTIDVHKLFQKVLIEVSARKGTHILNNIGLKASPSTCLRAIHNMDISVSKSITAIGIDDWAYKKGLSYGTIIINQETGRPIDLLPTRECEDVKAWLSSHPDIKHITRDRATGYASAIQLALPNSLQIADKFHLVKNLNERIEEEIRGHYKQIKQTYIEKQECLQQMVPSDTPTSLHQDQQPQELYTFSNKRKRTIQIIKGLKRCKEEGMSRRESAKVLGINKCTANKYWDKEIPLDTTVTYTNNYMAYIDDIKQLIEKGLSKKDIFTRITEAGFKGKLTAFYCWFNRTFPGYKGKIISLHKITNKEKENITLSMLSVRKLAIHVANPEWGVNKETGECGVSYLLSEKIISSSAILQNLREISSTFRKNLSEDSIQELRNWLEKYKKSPYEKIVSFVKGIKRDQQAVENAITYSWTNGIVEGSVNRLKTIKRSMYGRANFQLLRRKVCLSTTG